MFQKQEVISFWNKKPCGTFGVIPENINLDYFSKIRERRYKLEPFIRKIVRFQEWQGKKVLEIGCGIGIDGMEFAKNGADYTGIDISKESLELAQKYFNLNNQKANLLVADAEKLPFLDNTFDLVYSWGVLHHTPNPERAITEIYRVLKPEGRFCIMLYNRHSLVASQLYLKYGLLRGHPFISLKKLFAEHHESPGTKAYTNKELLRVFAMFRNVHLYNIVTPYDLRISKNSYLPSFFKN